MFNIKFCYISITNIYYITPKNFNDDIQNAIEYAFANNIPCVKLEGKKYVLTDSILVYSNMSGNILNISKKEKPKLFFY